MSASDIHDKSAILARRAMFIASALASVSGASIASAQEEDDEPPPACPSPPSPEDEDKARAVATEGLRLLAQKRFEDASMHLHFAYDITRNGKIALAIIEAEMGRDQVVEAYEFGASHVRCVGPDPAIEERLVALAAATAVVTVVLDDPSDAMITIDQRGISRARASRGVRVSPGRHELAVSRGGAQLVQTVDVVAGQQLETRFGVLPPPQPCLSPYPCLVPPLPPPPSEALVRLQAGVLVPLLSVAPSSDRVVGAGTGAHFEVAIQPTGGIWITPNAFGSVIAFDDAAELLGGGGVDIEFRPVDAFGFGLGFTGGYLGAMSDPARWLPSGGFLGPVLVPASIFAGPFYLEARVPFWFSEISGSGGAELGFGRVAPHVVVGLGVPVAHREPKVQMAGSNRQ